MISYQEIGKFDLMVVTSLVSNTTALRGRKIAGVIYLSPYLRGSQLQDVAVMIKASHAKQLADGFDERIVLTSIPEVIAGMKAEISGMQNVRVQGDYVHTRIELPNGATL